MERITSGRGGEALSLMRFDVSTAHEAAEEFILPDYMPEVRRIVSCSAHALPENKYLTPGAVELSGLTTYSVLYIGDDGALSCAPLNSEYSVRLSCPADDGDEYGASDVGAYTTVESVSCRASGPRKLALTARMRSRAFSVLRSPIVEKITAVNENGEVSAATTADSIALERHYSETEASSFYFETATGTASGEFREREGTKMILCSGSMVINSASVETGGIAVRGDAYLNCLMLTSDGTYSSTRVKTPVEEHIRIDSAARNLRSGATTTDEPALMATAWGRVASASVSGDESGLFQWEIEYDIDAELATSEKISVTDDAYSTSSGFRLTVNEPENVSELCCGVSSLTVYGSKQITGGSAKSIPYSTGRVNYERAEVTPDGRVALIGNCVLVAATVGDGDAVPEEITVPVKFECDARIPAGTTGVPNVRCSMETAYTDARLDGDKLTVTAELAISYSITVKSKVRHISEIEIDRSSPIEKQVSSIKVYFPEDGEGRWEIGRRYRCEDKCIRKIDGADAYLIAPECAE